MDKQIREFSLKIVDLINKEDLPIEVKRLVLKDILLEVEAMAARVINEQIKETENAEGVHENQLEE